jgi:hypothetical protein
VAAAVSGIPSTALTALAGGDPLEAAAAAGSLLLPREEGRGRLLVAAVPVHLAFSLGWGVALALVLPRRHTMAWGALAGLGIAALDLGIGRRRFPRIRALSLLPQVADHVAFGMVVAAVIDRRGRWAVASPA